MAFNRLAFEFPRLAAELERLPGDDLQTTVGRIVESALTATGVQVTDRSPAAVNTLVWSLDDVAWALQEAVDKGTATQLDYVRAFRRARAANGLLDLLENRFDSAVYESSQALSANEDAVLQLLDQPT
ncbi:MAG: hypothetical protein ABSA91_13205 [Acidimicrobiales bacterium]|jgi:hypothetical protein